MGALPAGADQPETGLRSVFRFQAGWDPDDETNFRSPDPFGWYFANAEVALLAVLAQRPSAWRPDRYPEKARMARDKVLMRMQARWLWSEARARAAMAEPVMAMPPRPPLLGDRLRQSGLPGYRMETLLDSELQAGVQALAEDYSRQLPHSHSLAVLVLRNADLAVRAYVGTATYGERSRSGYVDMVRAVRSPGSTLKPFVYGMALDEGLIHSHSLLLDTPRHGRAYRPGNFSGGFSGPVSATEALQRSLNLPAVQLVEHLGPEVFAARLENAGLDLQGPGAESPSSAVVLGGVGLSMESLAGLYASLARGGLAGAPRLQPSELVRDRWLMSPGAAWIIWNMLAQNPRPVPGSGGSPWRLAWKTGTSYGYRDAWAIGVSPGWTIAVWTGRPDGTASPGNYGRFAAAPLLFRVHALLDENERMLPRPETVTKETTCWPLGTRAGGSVIPEKYCMQRHEAWLLDKTAPQTLRLAPGLDPDPLERHLWIDRETGFLSAPGCQSPDTLAAYRLVLWPLAAEPWLPPHWRRAALIPRVKPGCMLPGIMRQSLRITGLEPDTRLVMPPGEKHLFLKLVAQGGMGERHWYLNGIPIGTAGAGKSLVHPLERPGNYQITVVDPMGNTDSIRIGVER